MSNLIAYQFKNSNIRIELKNNEPLFCLTDVANALNIKNHRDLANKQLNPKGVEKIYTPTRGGKQELIFIDEANLYRVIFRSNKKEAIDFQNWVFEEVLPSIRKTGSYSLTLNKQQQYLIKEAVLNNAAQTGKTYHSVYRSLYTKFKVPRYQDILAKDFDEALAFLAGSVKPINNQPALPNMNQDGRWLVIVENNRVTYAENINGYSCIKADVFKKLLIQTKQQAEYLVELAKRMRVIYGECDSSRLDRPIEELHPKIII
ncbi:BRO-N domain-containing protein [Snodgrassella alvi]|uniref:BRO-N domain-containing protein n=1 Tax=Snodgrassella alvi TaxID=1196083 RepID=UPI003D07E5FE